MELKLCAPCLFGLEGPLGNELRHMGMSNVAPENGRVRFESDEAGMATANIRTRFAERVMIELGRFPARSFDELFEGVLALPWENFIPKSGVFPVKGWALDSALHSIPDCQKIIKKAAAQRLGRAYGAEWLPEDGELYQIQFAILKDEASLYLDTSGIGLHKRGYRQSQVVAPLRETLAAAMVDIAGYRGRGDFCDPFCGSGTIAIEAALAAKNRAPGLNRSFAAEKWACFDAALWANSRENARSREFSGEYHIFGSDLDPKAVEMSRANAQRAGVADLITFELADARVFARETHNGVVVTNPPYGERIMEKREAEGLYRDFGEAWRKTEKWSLCLLSSHTEFERSFGRTADKKRKLYNGMIKCDLFIYKG
ncbi:MAG: class I SAM-dependent RNA methyltransferase [Oscillospiraceae bacterium]